MKQLTWRRIVHSGDWCLCLALHTPRDACWEWMNANINRELEECTPVWRVRPSLPGTSWCRVSNRSRCSGTGGSECVRHCVPACRIKFITLSRHLLVSQPILVQPVLRNSLLFAISVRTVPKRQKISTQYLFHTTALCLPDRFKI